MAAIETSLEKPEKEAKTIVELQYKSDTSFQPETVELDITSGTELTFESIYTGDHWKDDGEGNFRKLTSRH